MHSRRAKLILSILLLLNLIFLKLLFFSSKKNFQLSTEKNFSRDTFSYHFYITSKGADFKIIQEQYFQTLAHVHTRDYNRMVFLILIVSVERSKLLTRSSLKFSAILKKVSYMNLSVQMQIFISNLMNLEIEHSTSSSTKMNFCFFKE